MSCFGVTDEHLYVAELTVDKLRLTSETIQDVGDLPLLISIKFIDFPIIQISQHEFHFAPAVIEDNIVEFSLGQSVLFSKKPRDLIKALQIEPLKINVFRQGDTYPTAETQLFLSGCLCNQISMAENDETARPKPYVMKCTLDLMDPGENYAGTMFFDFSLTCHGKFLTKKYQVFPENVLLKNGGKNKEYYIERISQKEKQ